MGRKLLASLLLLSAACGSDSTSTASDAGAGDAGDQVVDGAVEVIPGRVTTIGEPCKAAADCGGKKPECIKDVAFPGGYFTAAFPGGYCSASCTQDSECSGGDDTGRCPLGQLTQLGALFEQAKAYIDPISTCLKLCTSAEDCRSPGYQCRAAGDALAALLPEELAGLAGVAGPLLPKDTFCFPEDIAIPALDADGGAGDGGASDDASADEDAAASDAGVSGDASDDGSDSGT